jgi:hypothetical protein
MHLVQVLFAASAALYLQKGDATGHVAWLLSSRTGSTGQGEGSLWANVVASLKSGGVKACGAVMNSTLLELAHAYTETHVPDVLSHVCHDGTFFHEFPTKEVCLSLTDKLVAEFNGKQDYVSWCKEFEAATANATLSANSSANATSSPAVPPPEPEPLMNASNASTHALVKAAPSAVSANTTLPAPKARGNASSGHGDPVLKVKKHVKKHKGTKKKKQGTMKALKKSEEALKTALKAVKAAEAAAAVEKTEVKAASSKAKPAVKK